MIFVRSYFGTNEPLTSWTLFSSLFIGHTNQSKSEEKSVHLHRSNFLRNPYFSHAEILHFKKGPYNMNLFSGQIVFVIKSVILAIILEEWFDDL